MKLELLTRALVAACAACVLAILAWTPAALAADGEDTKLDLSDTPAQAAQSTGGSGGIVRTIVGLAVVIAVIYGVTWLLRQVKGAREDRGSGSGLRTLATLPLGPSRSLHLVQAGTEVVLLGTGEKGVTPIRTYSPDEVRELGLLVEDADAGGEGGAQIGLPGTAARGGGVIEAIRRRTVIR